MEPTKEPTEEPMARQLYSPPHPAPAFARNRWISPRQAEMLESLWNARLRREARRPRPDRSREEQLRHIAETLGRTVASSNELSWREANRVLRRLLDEVRSSSTARAAANPATNSASGMASAPPKPKAGKSRKSQAPTSEKNARRAASKPRTGGRRSHD